MASKGFFQRRDLLQAANLLQLRIHHYAQGVFLIRQDTPSPWLPNRLFFVLDNPDGDENTLTAGSEKLVLEAGRLYFIPTCYPVMLRLNGRLRFLSVQFSLEFLPGLDLFSGCGGIRVRRFPETLARLRAIFDAPAADSPPPLAVLELNRLVCDTALELGRSYPEEAFAEVLRFQRYFPLIRYLERRGDATTRVSDLAAQMAEGRENFTRRFHAETGCTPRELLQRVLTGKATNLLLTGIPVKEAALRLGFSDEFVFSRFFKRRTGVSPSMWKNMNPLPGASAPEPRHRE